MDELKPPTPPESTAEGSPGPVTPLILNRGEHPISRQDIDPDVIKIIYRLHQQGFTAYVVGGAVRDLLLGKSPKDFDVATDARPGQIKKRFRNAFLIGRRFRLAHLHFAGGKIIEVATFRRDPDEPLPPCVIPEGAAPPPDETPASPLPEHLNIYGTPAEDAFRRDTTINGLFYDVIDSRVIDFVGGLEDLASRKVRIIGDPSVRFTEDPVRVWRVIRQAARLRFEIEQATEQAIPGHGHLVSSCSGSRLFEELNKDLSNEARPVVEALAGYGLLPHILGPIGADYAGRPKLLTGLLNVLEVKDRASQSGYEFSLEELYSLLFWPWAESLLDTDQGDVHGLLKVLYAGVRTQATLPKSLLAGVIQTQVIMAAMSRALRTGAMRWSLRGRPHYLQASGLMFMVAKKRRPGAHESFANLYREAFPESPTPRRKKKRRKRGRGQAGPQTQAEKPQA